MVRCKIRDLRKSKPKQEERRARAGKRKRTSGSKVDSEEGEETLLLHTRSTTAPSHSSDATWAPPALGSKTEASLPNRFLEPCQEDGTCHAFSVVAMALEERKNGQHRV